MLPLGRFTTGAQRQPLAALTYLMMLTRSEYVLLAILSTSAAYVDSIVDSKGSKNIYIIENKGVIFRYLGS
jgi:hypothetical protein